MRKILLFYLLLASIVICQNKNTIDYNEGMDALAKGDSSAAEILFLQSADIYKDAASFYRLGQLYSVKNTLSSSKKAERYFGEAAKRERGNVDYRRAYAKHLAANKDSDALDEFEEIIKDFPKLIEPKLWLADYYSAQSGNVSPIIQRNAGSNLSRPESKRIEDFKKAEELFAGVLSAEPDNREALWGMAELYLKAKNYDKSSLLLRKYCAVTDTSKKAFLLLGIIDNTKREWKTAKESFEKAFSLMTQEERSDYLYNSVVDLLKPKFVIDEHFDSKAEIEELIRRFWDSYSFNPDGGIYTREIEHYARTAFANIYLSETGSKSFGRNSAKGEAYVRYGIPDSVFSALNRNTLKSSQVWNYDDFYLEFTSNKGGIGHGNQSFFDWKKENEFQRYSPYRIKEKIEYDFYTFEPAGKNNSGEAEAYFVFSYPEFGGSARYKISVYDNELIRLSDGAGWISRPNAPSGVGCISTLLPQSKGLLKVAVDNGADTGTFISADYNNREIDEMPRISDIVFVSQIDSNRIIPGAIKRGSLSIVPAVKKTFNAAAPLNIYFEISGLKKGNDNLYSFEQTISFKKNIENDDEGLIEKIAGLLSKKRGEISESATKLTKESRHRVYLNQDVKNLKAGDYEVIIRIKDKVSGLESEKRTAAKITGS